MLVRPLSQDLARITLAVSALVIMVAASTWVMLPFVAATVWATMITIATWPMLLRLQRWLGGRRGPAAALLVALLVAVVVGPVWLGISAISAKLHVADLARTLAEQGLRPPPDWLVQLPVVGPKLAARWQELAGDPVGLADRLAPYLDDVSRWLVDKAGGLGSTVVQLVLTVVITGILYSSGEAAGRGVLRFLRRLAGERGESVGILAAKAIRAVALGIVVTALAQTFLTGFGLFAAQVPHAEVLTAIAFILCIAQLGPLLVLAPAAIWLFSTGQPGRGAVLIVFTVVAALLDNVMRPVLIRKGADLPLLLIMAGVIGGLFAFGVVGLFVGPVVLAVTWTLLSSWVAELDADPSSKAAPPSGSAADGLPATGTGRA